MGKLLKGIIQSQYHLDEDDQIVARNDLVSAIALDKHNKSKCKETD